MAQQCEECGETVYRRQYVHRRQKFLGEGTGSCRCYEREMGTLARLPDSTRSAFDITLDHVYDSHGQKLHVENLQQLSQAENKYGFESCVLNRDAQNFNDAPQQPVVHMRDVHKWKYGNPREAREMERTGRFRR